MMAGWKTVTKRNPCPACGKSDWCAWSPDRALKCERSDVAPAGMICVTRKDGGGVFRSSDDSRNSPRKSARSPIRKVGAKSAASAIDWTAESERLAGQLSDDRLLELSASIGIPTDALRPLGIGWAMAADLRRYHASGAEWQESRPDGAFAIPERDGNGRITGVSFRAVDGRKGAPKGITGARRGLIVPATWQMRTGPVLIVEGATDVAACEAVQLRAVGRPSNSGGAQQLAELLEGIPVIVVGENDAKNGGDWPGRKGAKAVATRLAAAWQESVLRTLPPDETKDIRDYLAQRVAGGLDVADSEACAKAGAELLAILQSNARETKPGKPPSQSERLVQLAHENYRIGRTVDDEPFAVRRDGSNIAIMFRGGKDALRAELARRFRQTYGTVPNASSLSDALTALSGEAYDAEPESVHVRIAEDDGQTVVDLGTVDGRAVVIGGGKWEVADSSPILFRRTALTGALPEPERGGDVSELRELLNVANDSWALLLGWLVAAFVTNIHHAILMLGGIAGSGKSTAGEFLVSLFDPSPAPRRSQPKDLESWATAAAGSWGVLIDNVSTIPQWWSDALCKAVTGDGHIRRRLYTDGDLAVLRFRRVIAITSIDAGALQGDLGSRLLIVELNVIDESRRMSESGLKAAFAKQHPRILGALLDIVASVLDLLETTEIPPTDRLADFSRVLAAMDKVCGTNALELYVGQRGQIAETVLDDDPVGAAIRRCIDERDLWEGTAGELHKLITPSDPPRRWPKGGTGMARRLRRVAPALRAVGIEVIVPRETDKTRRYSLHRTAQTARSASCGDQSRNDANSDELESGDHRAVANDDPPEPPDKPPAPDARQCADGDNDSAAPGGSGDSGGTSSEQSADDGLREAFLERAAIMEYDGGMTREAAEIEARRVTGYTGPAE